MTDLKLVKWKDQFGYQHLSFIDERDPDTEAPNGLPADPPDISQLDWESIKRDLHNGLVNKNLIAWHDVQVSGNGLTSTILSAIRKRIIHLYRMEEKDGT